MTAACLACALCAAGARHWLTPAASPPPALAASQEAASGEEDAAGAEALVLTLRPEGFEPAEVTVAEGQHLLVVTNRAGLDEFVLRLEREGAGPEQEAKPPKYKRGWKRLLPLARGTYVLTEAAHPEWQCRITVTPR
ncbi:MAG: hypothetical protein M3416_10680 [Acidobacteriota bacterium]|nr:hypothetical protein [Acidobacteriota bacterium]